MFLLLSVVVVVMVVVVLLLVKNVEVLKQAYGVTLDHHKKGYHYHLAH